MPKFILHILLRITIIVNLITTSDLQTYNRHTKLSNCEVCKSFVESFKRGMENTIKGKFDGGDAAWEEEKLGSYAKSELRLIEIQEKVCSDVTKESIQCYLLHEEYENQIEDWWLNHQEECPDLFMYFCVKILKHCCPDNHYGPECLPCPGHPNACSNNGKCKGNGTREGNGKCICNKGYIGKTCNTCSKMYFESYNDDTKICSPCPRSCAKSCTKSGCEECTAGWLKAADGQCMDIDECSTSNDACKPTEYCVNTEGSFQCLTCDISCDKCIDHGPHKCTNCAEEYVLVGDICVKTVETNDVYISIIFAYFGLCITTYMLYKIHYIISAFIGLSLLFCITVIELALNIM